MTAMDFSAVTTDRQIAVLRELVADATEHFVPMSASLLEKFDRLEWLRTEVNVFARNADAAEAEGNRLVTEAALTGSPGAVAKAARSAADAVTAAHREVAARGFAELAVPAVGRRLIASFRAEWPIWWTSHARPAVMNAYAAIDEVVPQLPVNADDNLLRIGGAKREHYLRLLDAVDVVQHAFSIRARAIGAGLLDAPVKDGADAFAHWSNPYAIDDSRLIADSPWVLSVAGMPGAPTSTLPDRADLVSYLAEASRRHAAWWCPTPAQQDAAMAAWLAAPMAERRRLAGLDADLPVAVTQLRADEIETEATFVR